MAIKMTAKRERFKCWFVNLLITLAFSALLANFRLHLSEVSLVYYMVGLFLLCIAAGFGFFSRLIEAFEPARGSKQYWRKNQGALFKSEAISILCFLCSVGCFYASAIFHAT